MAWGLAAAAALALAKNYLVDKPAAAKQRQLAAATQRYSPWTGLQAEAPKNPNIFNDLIPMAATGANIESNLNKDKMANNLSDLQQQYLQKQINNPNPYDISGGRMLPAMNSGWAGTFGS